MRKIISISVLLILISQIVKSEDWECGTWTLKRSTDQRSQNLQTAPNRLQIEVGQIETFRTHIPENEIDAICRAISEHAYLYTETDLSDEISDLDAKTIVQEFDRKIYPQVHDWIGNENSPGIDRDRRITILLHDVGNNRSSRYFGGYFSPSDLDRTDPRSNWREMLYMDIFSFHERSAFTFFASLAHEFAHLVNWHENGGITDERWLEEGTASFAEWAIYENVHTIFVENYFKDPSVSLTNGNTADLYYGASFLFLLFGFEQFGKNFIETIVRSDQLGMSGISISLPKSITVPNFFLDWATHNFFNDPNFNYNNLDGRFRVNAIPTTIIAKQILNSPIDRRATVEKFGTFYARLQSPPRNFTISLDGEKLHAQIIKLTKNRSPIVKKFIFDENGKSEITFENVSPIDEFLIVATATSRQNFRYAIADKPSGEIGNLRPDPSFFSSPKFQTQPTNREFIINRSINSPHLKVAKELHLASNYQAIEIVDDLAFLASGWGIEIFDLADDRLTPIAEHRTDGDAQSVFVADELIFVADGFAGVQIFSFESQRDLRHIHTVDKFKNARQIEMTDQHIYVLDSRQGLFIFDREKFLELENPPYLNFFPTRGEALRFRIFADRVYLSDSSRGIHTLKLRDGVTIPTLIKTINLLSYDFRIVNDFMFVAGGEVSVVDLRDPLKPKIISTINTDGVANAIQIRDEIGFVADLQGGLQIIDFQNINEPKIVFQHSLKNRSVAIDLRGDFAYVAEMWNGIQIIDLLQLSKLYWIENYHSVSKNELSIFNTDRDRVAEITKIPVQFAEIVGDLAFVGSNDNFVILDFSDLPQFREMAKIKIGTPIHEIAIENNFACVATAENGLKIFNVSEPDQPKLIMQHQTIGNAIGVTIQNNVIYVLDSEIGAVQLDLANNLQIVKNYETETLPIGITTNADFAYLLDRDSLTVIDNRSGEILSKINGFTFAEDLKINNRYLYISDLYGIHRFQIPDENGIFAVENGMFSENFNDLINYKSHFEDQLFQNFPNPLNPETFIPFEISQNGNVIITIFNVDGEIVRRIDLGWRSAGKYFTIDRAAFWDGKNQIGERVSSGCYFYQIETKNFTDIKKMIVVY